MKKGQPLFQLDRRPYEFKVARLEAQLAEAKQNVLVLRANVELAKQKVERGKIGVGYEKYMQRIFDTLASHSYRTDVVEQMRTRVGSASAREGEALAELERAQLQYGAQIDGVNTTANIEAQLKLARYYLEKIPRWSLPKPAASSISRSAPAWCPASSASEGSPLFW